MLKIMTVAVNKKAKLIPLGEKLLRNPYRTSSIITTIGVVTLAFILTFCSTPMSKETYLKKYQEFIIEINNEAENYNEVEWEKADRAYNQFKGKWYQLFKDEITCKEQYTIAKHEFQYNYIKAKYNAQIIVNQLLSSEEYKNIESQIKYYVDNDMEDDLRILVEQVKEISDTARVIVEKILRENGVDINELQNQY